MCILKSVFLKHNSGTNVSGQRKQRNKALTQENWNQIFLMNRFSRTPSASESF